ncbi:MAG TPA: hypothetical protein VM370_03160, partial [Candidatus Thermoplasmatota archaeon]|nr:hypothetical protein [Candidatus Thermoplasmatota archaeon]
MALAGLLAVPTGAAFNWAILGTHEPDNTDDTSEFMWQDAPGSAQKRVYFAVVTTTGGESLNVAALGTNQEAPTEEFSYAFLGRWVDCNGDGYVGNAETAMWEYDSALLLDTSVCPPTTGNIQKWNGQPNYNGLVSEFIPIGGGNVGTDHDTRVYRDGDAAVWGDFGRATDPSTAGGGTCALTPLPRGTLASTGGIINYAGCLPRFTTRWNNVMRDGQKVLGNPLPAADPTNTLGTWFEDEGDARVGNNALDTETFGDEDSSNSAAYVFDCSATPLLHVGDVTNS